MRHDRVGVYPALTAVPAGSALPATVALEQLAQHHQRVRLLLAGGLQVGAQQAERLSAAHGAPAAGDLLGQLDHAAGLPSPSQDGGLEELEEFLPS
jgi:hypothetical protein